MLNQFSRTELIYGKEGVLCLQSAKVAVFGIGGVGGYTVEALVRSGVADFDLFDDDKVCLTNLNRQLHATRQTVGRDKVEVARERILKINPKAEAGMHKMFYLPENADLVDLSQYDYIVDAVDTVSAKIELAVRAEKCGTPIISSMGAGNKIEAAAFRVADIYETSVCPLAKVMRNELRKRGVSGLKVVYSKEKAITPKTDMRASCQTNCICPPDVARKCTVRRQIPGSNAFVPATVGLIIAGEVINDLTGIRCEK